MKKYRLLPTEYKLYTAILAKHTTTYLEENNLLSFTQGGFRKNKTCTDHIYSLLNIYEDAIRNNKEIHSLFIDLRKAFDSMPHWAIINAFTKYGFPQHFAEVIYSLYVDNTCEIITDIGTTDKIKILNSTRQRDPLSPIIWILFIDPLLHWLNNTEKGYSIVDTEISNLAWCDDLVFFTNNRHTIDSIYHKGTLFCNYFHLQINPKKSGYTYRSTTKHTPYKTNEGTIELLDTKIPYKYLGIHISLDLDWGIQTAILDTKINKFLNFIKYRAITIDQKILAINTILIPTITHKMPFVYMKHKLEEWDTKIITALLPAAGLSLNISRAIW
jgi:hypothetical protein